MIRFFKELYLTVFTIGFRCRMPQRLGGGWGPDVDAGKGIAVISLITLINLSNIKDWIEIHVGTRSFYDFDRWPHWVVGVAVFLVNYYVLVGCSHGIRFEREFTHLKNTRKVLLVTSCALLLLATIVFSFYSDSAYRRFFHIPAAPPWTGRVFFK